MRYSNVAISVDEYSGFDGRTTIKSLPFLSGVIEEQNTDLHSDVALEKMNLMIHQIIQITDIILYVNICLDINYICIKIAIFMNTNCKILLVLRNI